MDPLHHPDLERLGRRMRDRLEATLDAEQHAAFAAAQRRRSIRDRLLEWEDSCETIRVSTVDGQTICGRATAVGTDHVVIDDVEWQRHVAIQHIVTVEVRRGRG